MAPLVRRRSMASFVQGRLLAAAAAAALALGGCGGGSTAPGTGPAGTGPAGAGPAGTGPAGTAAAAPSSDGHGSWDVTRMPDPCRLVTRAEVAARIAQPVEAGTRLQSWPPLCSFRMPGPPEEFLYVSDDSRPSGAEDFERQRSDSATPELVAGLGDKGYWLPDYTALHILSGTTHLTVKFAGSNPPAKARDKAMAVARLALPRAGTATATGPAVDRGPAQRPPSR